MLFLVNLIILPVSPILC